MRGKLLALVVLASAGTWMTSLALGQARPSSSGSSTPLLDRLDEVGRKIFGGALSPESETTSRSSDQQATSRHSTVHGYPSPSNVPRAGSIIRSNSTPVTSNPAATHSGLVPSAGSATSGIGRLHQRLTQFSQSAFPAQTQPRPEGQYRPATDPAATGFGHPASSGAGAGGLSDTLIPPSAVPRRAPAAPRVAGPPSTSRAIPTRAAVQQHATDGTPNAAASAGPAATVQQQAPVRRPTPAPSTAPEAADSTRSAESETGDNLLFSRESPRLEVATIGPRRITIGKASSYELTIRNSGRVAADQVVLTIDLPPWAEVVGSDASRGTAGPAAGQPSPGYQWEVGRLEGDAEEKLVLRIVPRESRPFDLAVKWSFTPAASQAMIEVQEPKLEMRLDGPREVLYGQSEIYRLHLVNSGTGDAENVEITLVPMGMGKNVPATHRFGTLRAGQTKVVELELTAREAGTLTIQVDARGDAGLEAHLAEQITVHCPKLEIELEAPPLQYVGTEATYQIRVSNPGTAAAENLTITATIPPEAAYVSNLGNARLAPDQTKITWTLDRLDPGAERTLQLVCRLAKAGPSRVDVLAAAEGGLTALKHATTNVEAMADLELDVADPTGPVPVGTEATYRVRVHNRGTKSAEAVEVAVYFSQGVEPTAVEGGRHQTAPGQVLFDKIPSLGAGQDVSFQIKAKAQKAGNHICRVEVYCQTLGTRLVSEETTHYYDLARASQESTESQSAQANPRQATK